MDGLTCGWTYAPDFTVLLSSNATATNSVSRCKEETLSLFPLLKLCLKILKTLILRNIPKIKKDFEEY